MAIAIPNQWDATGGPTDIQQAITPTSGNWLIAIVTWRTTAPTVQPTINVTDPSRNMWWLLSTRTVQASSTSLFPGGPMNVQVWACPKLAFAGWSQMRVYSSIAAIPGVDLGSVCVKIVEVSGMGNGFLTVDSVVVTTASVANSVTVTLPTPSGGADCLMIAAAAGAIAYGSYSTSGTGWAQLDNVTNTNPEVGLFAAWREATTGGSCTFSLASGFNRDWAAVGVSIRQTGVAPVQSNPNWPLIETQIGFGYDLSTPLSAVGWATIQNPVLSMDTKRGVQYELGVAQAEPTNLTIRNSDGGLTPGTSSTATATAAGSTTTLLCTDSDASPFNVGDFVQLWYSPLNPNYSFESGTTGWTAVGGTLTTTTSVGAIGTYAGQMTPNGTTGTVQVKPATHVTVTAGAAYKFWAWVRCAVTRTIELRAIWYDSANATLLTNIITLQVAANTWTLTNGLFTAPAGAVSADIAPTMTGTPPASNVMYVDTVYMRPASEFTTFKVTGKSSVSGTTTISFQPADGSGGGALLATKTGDELSTAPVDVYTPYRQLAAWGGKRHYVTAGWAESWPQTWDKDGFVGEMAMTGTGTLANLTAANPTCLAGEIMRRNPYSYWPLSDGQQATAAQNVSGRGTATLVATTNSKGAAGTNNFGTSTQGVTDNAVSPPTISSLIGDPGNGWIQTGISTTNFNAGKGAALVANDSGFPPIANGITIFLVHYMSTTDLNALSTATIKPTVILVENTNSSAGATGAVIKFGFEPNSANPNYYYPIATYWDRSSHAATSVACTSGDQWALEDEFLVGALAFNKTSWKLYSASGRLAGSGSCNLADSFSILNISGEADQYNNGNPCPGIMAHIAVFDRMLSDNEILTLNSAMNGHSGDEYTANRVQRKLDTIGMKAARAMSTDGQRTVSAEGTEGSTIADINNLIGGYEDAIVFEDATGAYQYRPPELYSTQTPVATLGENTAAGEIPYQPGVTSEYDSTYIYNSITVTNTINDSTGYYYSVATTDFVAIDSGSTSKYGIRSLSRETRLENTSDATHIAQRLLSRYSTTQPRLSEISIDPASNPNAWQFCLTVEVGDRVTVNRRPLNGRVISFTCTVLQVAHTGAPGAWKTTLTLTPALS